MRCAADGAGDAGGRSSVDRPTPRGRGGHAWRCWFDKVKGFGFANVFGNPEDVFIHIEVLRRSGLSELQPGEAICLRVVHGQRGCMAAQVTSWDSVVHDDEDA